MAARQKTVEPESAKPRKKKKTAVSDVWVGEHSVDGDILVSDSPPATDGGRVSYYSLNQRRPRVFASSSAASMIREVTDEKRVAQAREDYARREELEAERDEARVAARADVAERQREQVIKLHERYMDGHGLTVEGVSETPGDHKSRRSRCHACGISLDDFVGMVCVTCNEVLCSCGACGCGRK